MAERRLLSLTIGSSGAPDLVPVRLRVEEAIDEPFSIEVVFHAKRADLTPKDLLAMSLKASVSQVGAASGLLERHFHGVIVECERLGPGIGPRTAYRVLARPAMWMLGLSPDCRIFQDKTVKDIVDLLASENAVPVPTWGMNTATTAMPYCTQYNETHLAFVGRLLQEHGLSFYFTHTASSANWCICGGARSFPSFEGDAFTVLGDGDTTEYLRNWRRMNRVRTGSAWLDDMDADRNAPSKQIVQSEKTKLEADEPAMSGKLTSWPGGASTRPGVQVAKRHMAEQEAASEKFLATTMDPRISAGVCISAGMATQTTRLANQQYLVTGVVHDAVDESGLEAGATAAASYSGGLTLSSAARAWSPAPRAARPIMAGVFSATVTGPSGEQIHVDETGRIKIRFRWDHGAKKDDTSSCWVRVAQMAAGAWGGSWFVPRVGDEVLVSFLDGDPDRPVVTGAVYSTDAPPPFDPKTNRAQTGIATRSYKSSAKADANILRFEDKKDSEEVLLHAQKDLTVEVENNETRTVDNARTTTIKKGDETLVVEKGKRTTTIKTGDETLNVDTGHRTTTIKTGNETLNVDTGDRTTTIKTGNETLNVNTGHRTTTIKTGNETLNIDLGNRATTIKTGNDDLNLKIGNLTVKCALGAISLEAMQKITLKVGQNTIVVDQTGITLKGLLITEEAQVMHKTKAVMVQEQADAMVQVQGGIVMIN